MCLSKLTKSHYEYADDSYQLIRPFSTVKSIEGVFEELSAKNQANFFSGLKGDTKKREAGKAGLKGELFINLLTSWIEFVDMVWI